VKQKGPALNFRKGGLLVLEERKGLREKEKIRSLGGELGTRREGRGNTLEDVPISKKSVREPRQNSPACEEKRERSSPYSPKGKTGEATYSCCRR